MNPQDFEVAKLFWNDNGRLIGEWRALRWDVAKWGVAVNLGLATASSFKPGNPFLFALSVFVACCALVLIFYYNNKMAGARGTIGQLIQYLAAGGVDLKAITARDLPR